MDGWKWDFFDRLVASRPHTKVCLPPSPPFPTHPRLSQKDKYENEELIRFGLPEDVWFHVDDLSSAHVYLRQKPGEKLDDISPDLLLECASLVKVCYTLACAYMRKKINLIDDITI